MQAERSDRRLKKAYATIGPVPLPFVAEVLTQLDAQGWTGEHVSFAGMVVLQSAILRPGAKPEPVPAYVVIGVIEHDDFVKVEKPDIDMDRFAQ